MSFYKYLIFSCFINIILVSNACREAEPLADEALDERLSGGINGTVFDESSSAYTNVVSNLSARDAQVHDIGDRIFEASFVAAPAPLFGGLGSLYNNISCRRCHINDGRGTLPHSGQDVQSLFIKMTIGGKDEHGAPLPVPNFGMQLQDKALAGIQPEGKIKITFLYKKEKLDDGTEIELRKPVFQLTNLYAPLPAGVIISPRLARPVHGLGLVEAIDEASLLAHADPEDTDGDGISGKPNYIWDAITQKRTLGKIGWKASVASVKAQAARAFNEDIGITSSIFPKKNSFGQPQFGGAYPTPTPDIHDTLLNAVAFYVRTLAVPARRNTTDNQVIRGKKLFSSLGCVRCHADKQTTRTDMSLPALSNQLIRPYSDFLLHDMGQELADGFEEYDAQGNEWRTPPLWGIGLTERVAGQINLLHDGRARSFVEAILWHGGEAEPIKNAFKSLSKEERADLVKFLENL